MGHCLILVHSLFQISAALIEKAERSNSEVLFCTSHSPLEEALVYLIFSEHNVTNSFKGGSARLLAIIILYKILLIFYIHNLVKRMWTPDYQTPDPLTQS